MQSAFWLAQQQQSCQLAELALLQRRNLGGLLQPLFAESTLDAAVAKHRERSLAQEIKFPPKVKSGVSSNHIGVLIGGFLF